MCVPCFCVTILYPIISEDWTAGEELALLDLTRKMGLGAWDDIVESVSGVLLRAKKNNPSFLV